MSNYQVDKKGYYGEFGGAYVPEILYATVRNLQALLRDYVGRPSPLYYARRMSEKYGCQLYLKREDLNHTGAHKINNTVGQILLAQKMGKTRIIAETGAGQHGVATATVCALMNMKCEIFMGATDVERQHTNVERMKMLGAEVHPVKTGNMTLSDACSDHIPTPTLWHVCRASSAKRLNGSFKRRLAATIPTTSLPASVVEAMPPVPSSTIWMTTE